MDETKLHINDIIDLRDLQKIQDEIATATGLAMVIIDDDGKYITKRSNYKNFCELIGDTAQNQYCQESDIRGYAKAINEGEPYIFKCHTGLISLSIPIIANRQYLGAITAGQARLKEEEETQLEYVMEESIDWKQKKELLDAYQSLPVMSLSKVKAIMNMIAIIENYIVEKAYIRRIEKELCYKNIKLVATQKEHIELETALKDAELQALYAQINPHFLFNSLNTISTLAMIEKAPRTQEVIYSLADMLRYTIKKSNQMVSFKEEIDYITKYLKIQKVRFGERLRYQILVTEKAQKVEVPFMILQPFVENAIVHGLVDKEDGGTIHIKADIERKNIVISISDDGLGMSQDKLEIVMGKNSGRGKTNAKNGIPVNTGIGVNNVNQRIKHYFGKAYGVEINSQVDVGTEAKIIIPVLD